MRVVFLGSPEFALPTLRRLIASEHEVVAVYTQPDRPTGRGRRPGQPPAKRLALEHGLEVRQPASVSRPESVEELRRLAPDVGIIAAYGQILKQPVLDVPRLGVLNVHASLLPRWRGAAPVAAAILAGDAETGATIMKVRLELDAGPVLASVRIPIEAEDTTGSLTARIGEAGAALLMDVLPQWESGAIKAVEQDASLATYAPPVKKADALIDWARDDAETIWRQVRAYNPWPAAFTHFEGKPLRVLQATPLRRVTVEEPGTVIATQTDADAAIGFAVAAREGALGVRVVQGAGGRAMAASAYLNGHRGLLGSRLTGERD